MKFADMIKSGFFVKAEDTVAGVEAIKPAPEYEIFDPNTDELVRRIEKRTNATIKNDKPFVLLYVEGGWDPEAYEVNDDVRLQAVKVERTDLGEI